MSRLSIRIAHWSGRAYWVGRILVPLLAVSVMIAWLVANWGWLVEWLEGGAVAFMLGLVVGAIVRRRSL